MHLQHAPQIWHDFPQLAPGVIHAEGVTADAAPDEQIARLHEVARSRLDGARPSDLPEIQAWRRAFAQLGLKPTQYRCASESLLRRFAKDGSLPAIHPLIDLGNAVSLAFAIPVAVFDVSRIEGGLEVRYANGAETYETFAGTTENPEPGEVIFADDAGWAHARRWTNRQSARSAVRSSTAEVVIVAEALHESALDDIERLTATTCEQLTTVWALTPQPTTLTSSVPRIDL